MESGFDWSALAMTGNSLSLFGARRILELRIASGKPGTEGAEAIKRYAADLPPDTVTLVLLPKLDRATLATAWFEALDAAGRFSGSQSRVAGPPAAVARRPARATGPAGRPGHAPVPGGHGGGQPARGSAGGAEARAAVSRRKADPGSGGAGHRGRGALRRVQARRDAADGRSRALRAHAGRAARARASRRRWSCGQSPRRSARCCGCRRPFRSGIHCRPRCARHGSGGARAELLPRALRRVQVAELEEALLHAAAADRMGKGPGARRRLGRAAAPGAASHACAGGKAGGGESR